MWPRYRRYLMILFPMRPSIDQRMSRDRERERERDTHTASKGQRGVLCWAEAMNSTHNLVDPAPKRAQQQHDAFIQLTVDDGCSEIVVEFVFFKRTAIQCHTRFTNIFWIKYTLCLKHMYFIISTENQQRRHTHSQKTHLLLRRPCRFYARQTRRICRRTFGDTLVFA